MENSKTNNKSTAGQEDHSEIPRGKDAPVDPSNTSHIGEHIDQGIVSKKEGITEQSTEWEKLPEEEATGESYIDPNADHYIKSPSPEEKGTE